MRETITCNTCQYYRDIPYHAPCPNPDMRKDGMTCGNYRTIEGTITWLPIGDLPKIDERRGDLIIIRVLYKKLKYPQYEVIQDIDLNRYIYKCKVTHFAYINLPEVQDGK